MADTPFDSEEQSPSKSLAADEVQQLVEYTDKMKYQYEIGNQLAANPGLPSRFRAPMTFHPYVEGEVVRTTPELEAGGADPREKRGP